MADQNNPLTLCFVTTGDHPLFFFTMFRTFITWNMNYNERRR